MASLHHSSCIYLTKVKHDLSKMSQYAPRGERGVVHVAQQLVWIADGNQSVSQHLKTQSFIFGRFVYCMAKEWIQSGNKNAT